MNKLVTIKIGSGSSELGYPVILEIAEERSSDSQIWLHNQINISIESEKYLKS